MARKPKKNIDALTIDLKLSKKVLEKQTNSKFILKAKAIDLLELDSPNKVLINTIEQLNKRTKKINKISKKILKLEYKIAELSENQTEKTITPETVAIIEKKIVKKPRTRKTSSTSHTTPKA
jgi:inactivated superfamily I helicase